MALQEITEVEVKNRFALDNPWWGERGAVDQRYRDWPRRAYFKPFHSLVTNLEVQRAVVLMGPRRVGKTVMIQQTIQRLIDDGVAPGSILYVSVETPFYSGLALEKLLTLFREAQDHAPEDRLYVFYDEIQYLKGWEVHLKSLVDTFPNVRFVASGSAAAALRMKSDESGAGRFTDFLLPPLTFFEFVQFAEGEDPVRSFFNRAKPNDSAEGFVDVVDNLNRLFVDYLNYGGFPEAVFFSAIRDDFQRFVGDDIIDKVLLRDLPSLYGISDTQELNRLFVSLAYNSGNEVSLVALSQSSGVAINTLKRYLDYLEAAFLIQRIYRVNQNAKRFKRRTTFKVYLTNPCMRAALFGPVTADDPAMGRLTETAIFSQLMYWGVHPTLYYARWRSGEVDLVTLNPARGTPAFAYEIKWSDRPIDHPEELASLTGFAIKNELDENSLLVLTRTKLGIREISGHKVNFLPVSLICHNLGEGLEGKLQRGEIPAFSFLPELLARRP